MNMIDSPELRNQCADQLAAASPQVSRMTAFVGLDGFVDEILHVVDKRENAERYLRMRTIGHLADRLAGAAGKSTNVELVPQVIKLGGNGPIMANALASFGIRVTYLGNLGYPNLHPVFAEFAQRAEVHSIADPGHTDAYEFDDGKVMVGKHIALKDVTWENIQQRYGRDKFTRQFSSADLVGFVNWTMLPYMSDVWEAVLRELCPSLNGPRRRIFFDLADPEKRTAEDLRRALDLIGKFEKHFEVILGLNEKEANEVAAALGLPPAVHEPESLRALTEKLAARIDVGTLVVHPTRYALAACGGRVEMVRGLFTARPKITTGAGDHFNAGFCLGRLLGMDLIPALLTGVTNSGYYVRTGQSPSVDQLAAMMRQWPNED
jgi:sugar/nucleoside kinase (ribokinase family)